MPPSARCLLLLLYTTAVCMGVGVEELVACCTGGISCVHGEVFVADMGHDEDLGVGSIKLAACMWIA